MNKQKKGGILRKFILYIKLGLYKFELFCMDTFAFRPLSRILSLESKTLNYLFDRMWYDAQQINKNKKKLGIVKKWTDEEIKKFAEKCGKMLEKRDEKYMRKFLIKVELNSEMYLLWFLEVFFTKLYIISNKKIKLFYNIAEKITFRNMKIADYLVNEIDVDCDTCL